MRLLSFLAFLSALQLASAQDAFISALNTAGLASFASLLQNSAFSDVVSTLRAGQSGTVFAPNNAAAANLSSSNTNAVLYHIARGSFPAASIPATGDAIARSYLTNGTNLPGGQSQVLVLGKNASGAAQVRQGLSNATVTASTTYQNVVIHTLDSALSVPASLSATATAAGLTSLALTLQQVLPGLIQSLEQLKGITVFAPVNSAFAGLTTLLSSIPSATVQNVLANHLLNGTVLYTPSMSNNSVAISASGEPLRFITNSTGSFIQAANSTVRILIPDVPISNGVVHVIDGVLVTYTTDANQAQAAISSADAAASTLSVGQTGLVSQSLPTTIASAPAPASSTRSASSSLSLSWLPSLFTGAGGALLLNFL